MKINRILRILNEEWYTTVPDKSGEHVDVFINPSRRDIKDALEGEIGRGYGEVRFVADGGNENVYVWNANTSLFHRTVIDEFSLGYVYKGIAKYDAGDLEVKVGESNIEHDDMLLMNILDGNYDWMERYNFDLSIVKDYAEEEEEYIR